MRRTFSMAVMSPRIACGQAARPGTGDRLLACKSAVSRVAHPTFCRWWSAVAAELRLGQNGETTVASAQKLAVQRGEFADTQGTELRAEKGDYRSLEVQRGVRDPIAHLGKHPRSQRNIRHFTPARCGTWRVVRLKRTSRNRTQDCVNTLNFHCKSYHDVAAGQSVQLSHRGLSYSLPRLASSAAASDLTPANGGVS